MIESLNEYLSLDIHLFYPCYSYPLHGLFLFFCCVPAGKRYTAPRGYRVARDSISCCVEPGQDPYSWWLVGRLGACG